MKRWLAALAILTAICVTMCSCCCSLPFGKSYDLSHIPTEGSPSSPLLYKAIDGDGDAVWLFGSIHVGTDDMYPLPTYVTDAFDQADGLAVECDIVAAESDVIGLTNAMMKMAYADGSTIQDHIDPDLYADAAAILDANGIPADNLNSFTPSFWSTMIDSFAFLEYGMDAEKGIDTYLLKLAKNEKRDIYEIESVESQYAMLGGFSEDLQILLLEGSVESYGDPAGEDMLYELASVWARGDEQGLVDLLTDETTGMTAEEMVLYEEYNAAMMTDRNALMTDFAENALIDGNELFICVGAAHVVGDDGIAQQLRDRGYQVEIVQ